MPGHKGKVKDKTIQIESGQRIDRKTKQVLLFECSIDPIKRIPLKPNEEFNQDGANAVYEKYSKPQSKSRVLCLMDRMRFERRGAMGSNPFRKDLSYREIEHFFLFPENPKMFMLCTVDEASGKKSYELYLCKIEDVITLCNLTYSASKNPQKVVYDWNPGNGTHEIHRDLQSRDSEYSDTNDSRESAHAHTPPGYEDEIDTVYTSFPNNPNERLEEAAVKQLSDAIQSGESEFRQNPQKNHFLSKSQYNLHKNAKVDDVYSFYEFHSPNESTPNVRSWHPRGNRERPMIDIVREDQVPYRVKRNPTPPPPPLKEPIILPSVDQMTHSKASPPPRSRVIHTRESRNGTFSAQPRIDRNQDHDERLSHIPRNGQNSQPHRRVVIERDYSSEKVKHELQKARSTLDLRWGDEVTYITPYTKEGTSVNETGPVYIYVSRFRSQMDVRAYPKGQNGHRTEESLSDFSNSSRPYR